MQHYAGLVEIDTGLWIDSHGKGIVMLTYVGQAKAASGFVVPIT